MKKLFFLVFVLFFDWFAVMAATLLKPLLPKEEQRGGSNSIQFQPLEQYQLFNIPQNKFLDWESDADCLAWVNKTYNSLTEEERIAQFFMVAGYTQGEQKNVDAVLKLAQQNKIGGVIFFKGYPRPQAEWSNKFQAVAKVPLMIAIDGEWGLAMRLDSTISFPHQLTLGAVSDNTLIQKMGVEIGRECNRLGIQINFAPDIDVNSNPNNPIINDRSFGEDKYKVALKGMEYAEGMQSAGVLACAKHFPGHGDTDKDSHKTLPSVLCTRERLDLQELYPFKILFKGGVGSVMVAHLSVPALDTAKNIPASLSHKITTNLLKDTLGFEGLVFSDALNMKGVSAAYPPGTVDSMAFLAGNDILVFSEDCSKGIAKIKQAIHDGTITEKEIEIRVKKVLAYKYKMGLNNWHPIVLDNLEEDLSSDSARVLRQLLFDKAVTIATNEENLLPLKNIAEKKTASVSIDSKGFSDFQKYAYQFAEINSFNIPNESKEILQSYLDTLSSYEQVLVDLHGMSRLATKDYGISSNTLDFIAALSKRTKVILILFGSPYSLKYFDGQKNVVVAYEDNDASNLSAANVVFGGLPALGKLPVSASLKYRAGNGFSSDEILRLKISSPEEVGMKTEDLRELDEVVINGIIGHAYPGCQVLVAKDGKVIWNKSYGNKIYENSKDKVAVTDLYDLASVTKIAATTLAVMKLNDEGKLDIDKTVGDYLTLPEDATIKGLKVADVLTHNAGLKPFIEFFRNTIDTNYNNYYRSEAEKGFSTPVAENLFIRNDYADTMWRMMYTSAIKPNPEYVYSDIDFYILQKIVEAVSKQKLEDYVQQTFYQPMGLTRIDYKPLANFKKGKILPTENDKVFRKQQLQGFVHDPGAAMYGGVAGHAGLFSNAFDLAQVMQLLLNKGSYNGKQFFSAATVEKFTQKYSSRSRRGLGFDKPEPDSRKQSPCFDEVPLSVFGHTGFTGTCVWSDPENKLTFIFLSNRVYPDAENPRLVKMGVRGNLQKIVYKAMGKKRAH